jgi:hypothetical protein
LSVITSFMMFVTILHVCTPPPPPPPPHELVSSLTQCHSHILSGLPILLYPFDYYVSSFGTDIVNSVHKWMNSFSL